MYAEYAFTSVGRNLAGTSDPANADVLQTPGSEIGFRGEEKLGGGMSAWFQCSSTADIRGVGQNGFCSRNSAVGLKGGFGSVFVGVWDTPFKRTIASVGGRDTGVFGTAFLIAGNSTSVNDGASPGVFKRRQRNSINYDSPSFGGFQFMASTSSTNSSTATTASSAGAKPRVWSLGGAYKAGPVDIGAGYERHTKAYPNVAQPGNATFAGDEDGWHLSAAYTLPMGLKLGGTWTKQQADTAVGANAKVTAYQLGAEWKLSGPHGLALGYTHADDMKGTVGALMGSRPAVTALGNTGARLWQTRYLHDFSKRTQGQIGYVHLKNEAAANYAMGGLATSTGGKSSAVALSITHRF
jgi:predicted porin